jgi:uncharacterized membrane protein
VSRGYWFIPALCVVAAGLLALILVQVDEELQSQGMLIAFGGGPDSARSLLSTISTSMLSLTALTFSITMVVLQLASSQFSPRAIPTFLRDRQNQVTLGVFLATYVYALLALRTIRGSDADVEQFVPGVSVGLAVLLVVVSMGFFVAYIHHIATSIQVGRILQRIEGETRRILKREYPGDDLRDDDVEDLNFRDDPKGGDADRSRGSRRRRVEASTGGIVGEVDVSALVRVCTEADIVVRLLARPGDFVPEGAPLLVVLGEGGDDDALREAVGQVARRDDYSDVSLGIRQLVDIAERALSPGVNDPSTAAQALDHLHALLRTLATQSYPPQVHLDNDGRLRVITPRMRWADHVALVLDEFRLWGAHSLQVRAKLQVLVDDLLTVAPPTRREPLVSRLPLFTEPLPLGSLRASG